MGVTGYNYVTRAGDTFDEIALDAYNDEFRAAEIMKANPSLAGTVVFDAGITIRIPYLTANPPESLPPWKR